VSKLQCGESSPFFSPVSFSSRYQQRAATSRALHFVLGSLCVHLLMYHRGRKQTSGEFEEMSPCLRE
jgi:hypothetical protein